MNELSGYVFSSLREGDIALYRGSGNGLTPILLVAADESSRGCVERLEHEYALKSELDADWAARPVALTHDNGRVTLVLEDHGNTDASCHGYVMAAAVAGPRFGDYPAGFRFGRLALAAQGLLWTSLSYFETHRRPGAGR